MWGITFSILFKSYESVLTWRYSGNAVVPFCLKLFVFGHVDFFQFFKFLILHWLPENHWLEVPHVTWRTIHGVIHVNFWSVVLVVVHLFAFVNVKAVVFPWAFALSLHRYIVIVVGLLDDFWLYGHILGLNVIKFFVLHTKFARRNLVKKVHIRILDAFQWLSVQLAIIRISQSIKGIIFLVFNFLCRSQKIWWHVVAMFLFHSSKLMYLIVCSVMPVWPNINHHDIAAIENTLLGIELLLTSVTILFVVSNNVRPVFRQFWLLLWIALSVAFFVIVFNIVVDLKVVGWLRFVFLLVFYWFFIVCVRLLFDRLFLWCLLFIVWFRNWAALPWSWSLKPLLALFFWRIFLFLFTFTLEHTRLGLKYFPFRREIDDLIKLLILFKNTFDDRVGFLVDLWNLLFRVIVIFTRLLLDNLRIQKILFNFDLFSFK
jgi:hypothetical protein